MTTATSFVEQLCERLTHEDSSFIPTGGLTKSTLLNVADDVQRLDMSVHVGVMAYDPSEFLITAKAGTPIRHLVAALAEHGQYLPFDPLFVEAGSTLGGTIAAGVSGSNRLLYGGVRDFVMEVEFLDGLGKLVRGGGKVVKNAAGFDLPKLMVGSYGRLGVVTEATLKVFPRPVAFATLSLACRSLADSVAIAQTLQSQPLPITALDFASDMLHVRFAGPRESLPNVLQRAMALQTRDSHALQDQADTDFWLRRQTALSPQSNQCLVRVAMDPNKIVRLNEQFTARGMVTTLTHACGGSVTWLQVDPEILADIDEILLDVGLSAVVIAQAGDVSSPKIASPFLGESSWRKIASRVQQAIDPNHRFAPY